MKKNNHSNKLISNTKKILLPFSLLIIFIIISAVSYASAVSENISNGVFRLHVIANSDSEEDQFLKYIIRDNLINYMNTLTENISSKEEAIEIAKQHEQDFYKIAKNTVQDEGYNYDVKIEIGNFYFPTKYYGDISLPAGYYDALKVEIGQATRSKLVVCNVSSTMLCRYVNRCCSR